MSNFAQRNIQFIFCGVILKDLIQVDPRWLRRWNQPVPRYTSYPTAPQFKSLDEAAYKEGLAAIQGEPLSLYIHIPFCRSMCLFCGCSVVLNRSPEKQNAYLEALLLEIALIGRGQRVAQIHLGGGTPTSLSIGEFERLMEALRIAFVLEEGAELSIEIDPRTVYADEGEKLRALKRLGFNRVSFGVQDLDPKVQEAVRRRQTEEMSRKTFEWARELGFSGINLDLIYGLPFQSVASFTKTAETILQWQPDRIALFSYAKVPWLKAHQKAIPEETLPTMDEKFAIYVKARSLFMEGGYTAIGMDHFAKETDSLSGGYREGRLTRNFQGYSLGLAEQMIGLGVTSIGFVDGMYVQNVKEISVYQEAVGQGKLPVFRGFKLDEEDKRRRWVIQELMCRFQVDKREFEKRFGLLFDRHFAECRRDLASLKEEGLIEESADWIVSTPLGKLFVRLIAAVFDAYFIQSNQYSKSV